MNPQKYCAKIVKRAGSNFYYSFVFLPKRKKRAMFAIYAFSRIIDDIVDENLPSATKDRLLAFWRQQIELCYTEPSRHPLTQELSYAVKEFSIPKEYLLDLMMGVAQDMFQKRYATFEDLRSYCYRVASVVGLICVKIFEVADTEENKNAAVNLGLAFQMTNILRDLGEDANISRIYLPIEDLLKFNVTEDDILQRRYTENFVNLAGFEWDRANNFFEAALNGFDKKAKRKLLPAIIMADIYYRILLKIKEINFNVFETRVRVPNLTKIAIAVKRWLTKA